MNSTVQNAKSLAQKIAQQMQDESLEVLKTAKEQVQGIKPESIQNPNSQQGEIGPDVHIQDKLKSQRRIEALNREIEDIRKQKLFSELQRRISQGEDIPLQEYPGLSLEQKQVLNAQMEAVKSQIANKQMTNDQLVEPQSKKGRQLFNFGKKTAVKREQTRVEKPGPPSG